jgi:hypothetical protein
MLVRYMHLDPKSFVCPVDKGTRIFRPGKYGMGDKALRDLWDFGPDPARHCSYAYHFPFGRFALTASGEPGFAVAADRNPFIDSPGGNTHQIQDFKPDLTTIGSLGGGTSHQAIQGNCNAHQLHGQNVLYLDTHVSFEQRAYCSIEDDNIYLISPNSNSGSPVGTVPAPPAVNIKSRKDSVLVHDPPAHRISGYP